MSQSKLVESQFHGSSGLILQRHFNFQLLRLCESPGGLYFAALGVLNVQRIDTYRAGSLQVDCVFAADDQSAFLGGRNAPMRGTRSSQMKAWAVKRLEAPKTAQCAGDLRIELCGIRSLGVHHKSAVRGVRPCRKIQGAAFTLDMENKVVRNIRREDQRSALHRQHERHLLQAIDLLGVDGAQRRQLRSLDRRQSDNDDRHWLSERRGSFFL